MGKVTHRSLYIRTIAKQKLTPSPEADKQTLLRRLSLDLIGMPASKEISELYLKDQSEDA